MLWNKYLALAGTVLMLMGILPAAAQHRPAEQPPLAAADETHHEQVLQFLQQIAWARDALAQDLEGQGSEALDNAQLLLEDARDTSDAMELVGVAELLAQAQEAVRRGNYADAIEPLARIEQGLGQAMEQAVGTDRPQPPQDP